MNVLVNHIVFQIDKELENELETGFGKIYLDARFEKGRHTRIYGTVVGIPNKLNREVIMWRDYEGLPQPVSYYNSELAAQMADVQSRGQYMEVAEKKEYDRKMRNQLYDPSAHEPTYKTIGDIAPEVKIGDRIYFHYNTVKEENRFPLKDGRKLYLVRYDQVLCAVREIGTDGYKQIIPIGSHVLVEAVWDDEVEEIELKGHEKVRGKISKSGLITELHDKPKPLIGKIAHIGTPLVGEPDLGLVPGDEVYYLPESDWVNTIEGRDYYIMKQKDIIAKI